MWVGVGKLMEGCLYHQATASGAVHSVSDRDVHKPKDISRWRFAAVWDSTSFD